MITASKVRNGAPSIMSEWSCVSNMLSVKFCHHLHWFALLLNKQKETTRRECEIHKTERKVHKKSFLCFGKAYTSVGCKLEQERRVKWGGGGVGRDWFCMRHGSDSFEKLGLSSSLLLIRSLLFLSASFPYIFSFSFQNITLLQSYPTPQTNQSYFPLVHPLKKSLSFQ